MRDGLNQVKTIAASIQRNSAAQTQVSCPSCLSTTTFVVFIAIQLILMLGYSIYRLVNNNQFIFLFYKKKF